MRHNLVISYCLSLLILGTILFISALAGPPQNSLFYSGSIEPGYFTPAFSDNLTDSNVLNALGFPKFIMMFLSGAGLALHSFLLHKLLRSKNLKKKERLNYTNYWAILFVPYIVLLLIAI